MVNHIMITQVSTSKKISILRLGSKYTKKVLLLFAMQPIWMQKENNFVYFGINTHIFLSEGFREY